MNDEEDPTARVGLTRVMNLELLDSFVCGWREAVFYELDRMRREMPYADTLEIRLVAERRNW